MNVKLLEKIAKRKTKAFGKDVFLLGQRKDGSFIWLEAPKWDCGWYWGFGYVETYTNNAHPERSRDIQSHEHWDGMVGIANGPGKWIHHLNEVPDLAASVLTEKESWELSDLMKSFYTLSATAGIFHRGNSHLTSSQAVNLQDAELAEKINKEILPRIFGRILEILTPAPKESEAIV